MSIKTNADGFLVSAQSGGTVVNNDGFIVGAGSATEALDSLMQALPGFSLLTERMKLNALAGALMPDVNGVWPGRPGYITTHDEYFAAVGLLAFLQAQPVVRQVSSEGTSTAVDAPNWTGLISYYRSMSPIAKASGGGVIGSVPIPQGPHVRRTDMHNTGRGYGDDNVDTDLG